ncbi:ABC-type transport system involved in multi-copper enzyme maturation permease subunit [Parabacteroides sp. PF5-5]|uniref:ABC transporter permease n=1 Tax=unclassified Parabacteroides TaxID=2649774 RepID=UPI002474DC42|nr:MULTISPECIES: ABC transporter permease subunit [unclassified Parabacteroides]MDH6303895.1 ABC-type transport system involved in multi-copper enzyme maturation permease subunit [Parabacteroides sp. PH5-39]MDH6314512.1 ABC-type transport system involved in multi-copper enzyme maturation permease subunit [Parabacteroides sp. PF5-13]MDH6318423.1 ABC-type transport system involved in multi-copper enzyme maturation permease subunit [Parabacteroides sp. PH5-13]MDH6322284.1 ABC-type transport system
MIKTLYIHEIQKYLYSLRFKVSFAIMLLVFVVGTISFVSSTKDVQSNYAKYRQLEQETLAKQASNISDVATSRRNYIIAPRNNTVVADCKESLLPNRISYNAYNVHSFDVRHDSVNPLLTRSENLSWGFIVSMFLSFITLLFAFDAVSGEKEDRTLALVFSNSVSRAAFLGSKLLSIITVVGLMTIIGIILSLLIIAISGSVVIDTSFMLEIIGFLAISLLFITVFSVFGLFSSVVTRYSNVSLLISLCFWLFAAVIIPNTSVFWAKKLFPIPTGRSIEQAISQEKEDINKNAPEGSWASMWNDPFYPKHELRANNQTNLMNAEKRHRNAYYQQMFRQFENTRSFTLLSPIAQFDYINEAFLGGGYLRFRKNWSDLHMFQEQFLQWFKDIDAKDDESPHWYNPYESLSTSRKPVSVEQIPQYQEQIAPFADRFLFMSGYLIVMLITIAVLFIACFYFFVRYDMR